MRKYRKLLILICLFLFIITIYLGIYLYATICPKLSTDGKGNYYFYDKNNTPYTYSDEKWTELNNISESLKKATISIEDKNFYKHQGFDYPRILKALFINIKTKENKQGASTITQQYSKNLFLNFNKTWKRKLKEAWITIRLETHYSKNKILEGYLNTINYGGVFGIENASRYYFNKSAKDLTLAESSILAGIPKNPTKYSPLNNEKKAKERQKAILNSMVKNKYITINQANDAYNTKLIYQKNDNKETLNMTQYYQDAAIEELKSISSIPHSLLETKGLKIYTNLNPKAEKIIEQASTNNITNNDIQLAGAIIEPKTGKIIALTGGKNYNKSQYNRLTKAKRQIGSTIKPFLYYSALENGFTPSTTFTSEKTTFSFENGKTYTPKNYNNKYPNKSISMASAIAYSDNIYAVKTHLFLGTNNLVNILKRIGITNKINDLPSLALGAEEINMMQMLEAYSVLANEGTKIKPYIINKVTDMNGKIIYKHQTNNQNILNKNTVYILNELLTTTYDKNFIDYSVPTCYNISPKITRKYSIKSGTTNTDNLIFGYTPDLLVGLWTGYDSNKTVNNLDSSNIKNMWIDIMENYLDKNNQNWYKTPSNIIGVAINPINGKIAKKGEKAKVLYYIKGTEPSSNYSLDETIPTIKTN